MSRIRHFLPNSRILFRNTPQFRQTSSLSNVRLVKFKRPWFRKFISSCLLYGVAFHLWSSFVLLRFDDTLNDATTSQEPVLEEVDAEDDRKADRNGLPGYSKNDPEDTASIFIPLNWPRLRKSNFYAASDPEWQEFIKISQDREKLKGLKDELASIVLSDASQSNLLSRMLGGPLTVTGFWLIHHFPSRAPPEYCRSGLELNDEGVAWVSRAMSTDDGDRLQRCTRPLFVALAVRDAYLVFWRRLISKFSIANSNEERNTSISNLSYRTGTIDFESLGGLGDISRFEPQMSPPNTSENNTPQGDDEVRPHPSFIISTLQRLPLPKLGPGSDLYAASLAFKWRLNECWSRELHIPRRGVFYFIGPVGLRGPKGFCRIEVKGEFDPSTSTWVTVSMHLKDLSIFNQKALGG